MGKHNVLGAWGEMVAATYLRKRHIQVLGAGYRCRFGEIDLIAVDKKYLIFVEVKLRKTAAFADAREYVDIHKQERLRKTAAMYLAEHPTKLQPRFDVIEIYAPQGVETANPKISYLEDAFQ